MNNLFLYDSIADDIRDADPPRVVAAYFDDDPIVICPSAMTHEYVAGMIGALWSLRDAGADDRTIYDGFMDDTCRIASVNMTEYLLETWVACNQRLALAALASTPADA